MKKELLTGNWTIKHLNTLGRLKQWAFSTVLFFHIGITLGWKDENPSDCPGLKCNVLLKSHQSKW